MYSILSDGFDIRVGQLAIGSRKRCLLSDTTDSGQRGSPVEIFSVAYGQLRQVVRDSGNFEAHRLDAPGLDRDRSGVSVQPRQHAGLFEGQTQAHVPNLASDE